MIPSAIAATPERSIENVSFAPGNISILFGLCGPNTAVATACASAANAIADAFRTIRHGYADVMVTGGTESCNTSASPSGKERMRAIDG